MDNDPQKNNCHNCNCHTWPCQILLKSRKSMKYNISKNTAPQMPPLRKGLECSNCCNTCAPKTCGNPWFRCFPLLGIPR